MRKIALHWQILIALIVAILYGLSFPTTYQINDKSFKILTRNRVPSSVQKQLAGLEGKNYKTLFIMWLQVFSRSLPGRCW